MELSVRSVKHEVNTPRLSGSQEGLPQTFELGLCRVRVFADARNRVCMWVCVCKGMWGAGEGGREGEQGREEERTPQRKKQAIEKK